MKIAIAQIDPWVGAFAGNVKKIAESYERACQAGARLLITPELSIAGYPPHDLVERPEMFERNEKALAELAALTKGQKKCALAVGHVARNPSVKGRAAQNVVSVLEGGKEVFRQAKTLLPTYDVFDEARYFEPASEIGVWECDGKRVAFAVCEDLWGNDPAFGRQLYGHDPIEDYRKKKLDLLISISSSPYEFGKRDRRESLHCEVVKSLGIPFVYVNQVGATDEILFDGGSFAADAKGKVTGRLPFFSTAFGLYDSASSKWLEPSEKEREDAPPSDIEVLSRALVAGIREYFARTGFKRAIMGLSGGIDSAVVAVLASRAIGAQNILGLAMPSQYSSGHSLEDAEQLSARMGIPFEVRPIKFIFSTFNRDLSERRGELAPLAQENLQSRLRGNILMTLSNHYNALVLTTGNKSELAVGYCTQYGDMVGAIAPIGDLFKTRVYELARHINATWRAADGLPPIPERSIEKAPSAELRPNQTDQDTLPPYEALDALLEDYLERSVPVAELVKKFGKAKGVKGPEWVTEILRKIEINEYKRRQGAPVLKVSHKAFGIGRRIPIAKVWDQ